ncbi:hypothetical protein LX81_00356 [Palleronia aestuarii]|uniref:Uncharacterized protein n=1 Tax=Palleronia aestuarii TaxID=568105 RepID=A0A2W7P956_9RHOB|nr:hypothetical protein [Palleronia aestuarii]PZX19892.1 hypothetical protein LX81_00356 [Palleronia aestuarii]
MRIRTLLLLAGSLATQVEAQSPPLSAIDWLSDSISVPEAAPRPERPLEPGVTEDARADPITVEPLDELPADAQGLFEPQDRRLPDDLWSASQASDVATGLARVEVPHLRAAQRLLVDMLSARSTPPQGSANGTEVFLARIDALLAIGQLQAARALLDRAEEEETPENFRRWFDIALLTGQENRACERMRAMPEVTPTYPARIFCLARGGDWMAAALTLDSAKALDVIDEDETERLTRFLDDHAEGGEIAPPARPSPLDFAILEAIGEPLATTTLPLAFSHADLRHNTGWKARIEAAERLARFGAIPPSKLWEVYLEREPAASGTLWDRVGTMQDFDRVVQGGEPDAISADLPAAWEAMRDAGLATVLAERYAGDLDGLVLDGRAAEIARRISLLAGTTPAPQATASDFLGSVAAGKPQSDLARTPLESSLADGFSSNPPAAAQKLIDQDRIGEALLLATAALDEAASGNLDSTRDGLAILNAAGQKARAVEAALELLILERHQ